MCIPPDASPLKFAGSRPTAAGLTSPAAPANSGVVKTGITGVVITGPGVVVVAFGWGDVEDEVQPAIRIAATMHARMTRGGTIRLITFGI